MRKHGREIIGFSAILTAFAFFLTSFVWAAAKAPAGRKLFEVKCSQCHDKDARGNTRMAKILRVDPDLMNLAEGPASKLKAEELEVIVTHGKKEMPRFKGKLTAEQIKSVVEYVKSLQAAPAPAK